MFLNVLINAKSNVPVYQGHINFRKGVSKSSQLLDKIGCQKYKVSFTAIAKLTPANISILISTKFKNQTLLKTNDSFLKAWLFPFLGHFCMPWVLVDLISKYFLLVSLFLRLCIEIKSNGARIFLLARTFIKQSRDLTGYDYSRPDHLTL